MAYDWRMQVVEPGEQEAGARRLRTLVGLSPAARQLLAARAPGTSLTLGVDVAADGTISGAVLPPEFAAAAHQAGLQVRVELVADGYEKRHVDFAKVHGVREGDLALLAQTLGLRDGARVLDLGCGCGEVSASILAEADRQNVEIDLHLCDLHGAQLALVPTAVARRACEIVVGDARSLPFPDDHFDSVVMKMALHEVPQCDQPLVCAQVLRVLRPGGVFVVWGVMPPDSEVQDVFNAIMQEKNALAGYESLVRDRYFFRLDQLLPMLGQAGFEAVREVSRVHFRQSTLARRDSELGGSDAKLQALNAYCRAAFTAAVARRIDVTEAGDDIQFTVPNHIVAGRKPLRAARCGAGAPPRSAPT